jgi:DNA-binding NtrC family response regulator
MKVLVIEDVPDNLREIANAIRDLQFIDGHLFDVKEASSYESAIMLGSQMSFDLLITDMRINVGEEGLDVIKFFANKLTIAIVITGFPSIPNCVEAMRAGAWDYIEKNPMDGSDPFERLLDSIRNACEYRRKNPQRGVPNPDVEWVHKHFDELAKEYPNKLIAVLFEKVVDSDVNFGALSKRMESKYPLAKPTIVSIPDLQKGVI